MKVCVRCGAQAKGDEILMGDEVMAYEPEESRIVHGWACGDCLRGKPVEE